MNIREQIIKKIRGSGPLSISEFMDLAVDHYYANHEPFGTAGDFITAPEISQIFGEMVGVWCVMAWERLKRPNALHLVELGPGRGTLMADLLRATAHAKEFHDALSVHLVERSKKLRAQQRAMLENSHRRLAWHERFGDVPPGPMLLIANEFFDALAIRQFVKRADGFHERMVGLNATGDLHFMESPHAASLPDATANEGETVETCEPGEALVRAVAGRIRKEGGEALVIDYGYTGGHGDTLQALKAHEYAPPLKDPGGADITALVDFAALKRAAEAEKTDAAVTTQAEFLNDMGAKVRLERLCTQATLQQQKTLISGYERLTAPGQMGTLFKAMTITAP